MDKLKNMKKTLVNCVESQITGNLKDVDTKELGEAVDMIKDLEEAIYYATITKAMEGGDEEEWEYKKQSHHKDTMYYPYYIDRYPPYIGDRRGIDRPYGRMYYDDRMMPGDMNPDWKKEKKPIHTGDGSGAYQDRIMPYYEYPMEMLRDEREGRSPISRKHYMESKEHSHDTTVHMKELEKYLQELSQDVTEMVQNATPEEKQMLQQKISLLATKIK